MNREDIIRMAREAGLEQVVSIMLDGTKIVSCPPLPELERFASLVAAAEREKMITEGWRQCAIGQRTTQFCGQAEQARLEEREECAKVCDSFYESWIDIHGRYEFMGEGAQECADAIRARGQA